MSSLDMPSSSMAAAIETSEVAALPPAPVRRSSSVDSSSTKMGRQRPGSAPPAPSLERAPRAEVAAGIRRQSQRRTTRDPHAPSVDRVLAASAPAEEAGSSLWSSPEEAFQRVTAHSDCFPVGWVERGAARGEEKLPPAPVRGRSSSRASTSASSSSSSSRLLFPQLNGDRLLVVDRHPFPGDAPLLIPVTKGAMATAAALLGAGLLLAAAAVVRRAQGRRRAAPPRPLLSPLSSRPSDRDDADALLRRRGEAAAARLRSRFAGALDGGDQSGGGSLGLSDGEDGNDDDDESESEKKKRRNDNREAERAFRSFFSKAKMHLVDEDAWSKEKKDN